MVGGMISFRIPAAAAVLAATLVAAACGQGAGASSGGVAPATTATPSTTSSPAHAPADAGPGAAFAPAGSLLYVRTPGAGAAWRTMSRLRGHVAGVHQLAPEDSIANFVRLMVGADFAEGPPEMLRALTGEQSEVVVSRRAVRDEDGSPTADAFFYSQVSDRDGLARWLAPHYAPAGSDGGFELYRGRGSWVGYSALSKTAWLFATSLTTLRQAIATAAGEQPSVLADRRFTSAFSGVDAGGAALVGYTRGDLAHELRNLWLRDGQPSGTQPLTDALGLSDTAFAIGANGHGAWMRAAPHLPANGYRPGPVFTPSLLAAAPARAGFYVGVADGAAQLSRFDRLLVPLLGGDQPDHHWVEGLLEHLYELNPADLRAIGRGEQAWFVGPTNGVAVRTADPDRTARILGAVARRNARLGFRSGRDGDVVWLHGHSGAGDGPPPMPSMAGLVAHAGIDGPVSWIAAASIRGLFSGWSEDDSSQPATPQESIAGAVLAIAPGTAGRYRLEVYLDFGA